MINISDKSFKTPKQQFEVKLFKSNYSGVIKVQGQNGIGKSTFLNFLSTEFKKEKIKYHYFNQEIYLLENLNIKDNIDAFLNKDEHQECYKYLKALELENLIYKKVFDLSSGQKQKIQLLINLINKSNVIILDEPFNHLDVNSIEVIKQLILKNSETKLIIIVDHSSLISTKNIIDLSISNEVNIDISSQSKLVNATNKVKQIPFKYQFKNIALKSKISIFFLLITSTLISLFYFESFPINTYTDSFSDKQIVKSKPNEGDFICPNSLATMIYDDEGDIAYNNQINLAKYRNPLNKYFYNATKYSLNPSYMVYNHDTYDSYNGKVPVNNFSKLVYGQFPKDNTNEVMIDIISANNLSKNKNPKEFLNYEFDYKQETYKVTGIYAPIDMNSGPQFILLSHNTNITYQKDCTLTNLDSSYNLKIFYSLVSSILIVLIAYLILCKLILGTIKNQEQSLFECIKYNNSFNYIKLSLYIYFIALFLIISIYYFNS